jgi:Tol biopolymer transport system component
MGRTVAVLALAACPLGVLTGSASGLPATTASCSAPRVGAPIYGDFNPIWSPQGSRIALTHVGKANQTFQIEDVRSHRRHSLGPTSSLLGRDTWPSWSPNGRSLALVGDAAWSAPVPGICEPTVQSDIFRVDSAGGSAVNLTNTPAQFEFGPSWSPDGARIAYVVEGSQGNGNHLIVASVQGRAVAGERTFDLPPGWSQAYRPTWSPDGRSLVFTRLLTSASRATLTEIWMLDLSSSKLQQLTDRAWSPTWSPVTATWSPDSSKLAYTRSELTQSRTPIGNRIWVSSRDGSSAHALTVSKGLVNDDEPSWSPDGRLIAFTRTDDHGVSSLFTVQPDGHHLRLIAKGEQPSWSPDGRLAFERSPPSGGDISPQEKARIWIVDPRARLLRPRVL